MTSNLGTADLRKAAIGFAKSDEAVTYEKMKERVNEALKQHFRPEFLNRIDDTIVFHELTKAEVTQIVDLMIRRVRTQLESQGLGLELTDSAKELLADKGYDPRSAPGRCAGRSSAWWRTPSPNASSSRSSGPGSRSSSTPRTTRSSSAPSRASSPRPSSWPRPARRNNRHAQHPAFGPGVCAIRW